MTNREQAREWLSDASGKLEWALVKLDDPSPDVLALQATLSEATEMITDAYSLLQSLSRVALERVLEDNHGELWR